MLKPENYEALVWAASDLTREYVAELTTVEEVAEHTLNEVLDQVWTYMGSRPNDTTRMLVMALVGEAYLDSLETLIAKTISPEFAKAARGYVDDKSKGDVCYYSAATRMDELLHFEQHRLSLAARDAAIDKL